MTHSRGTVNLAIAPGVTVSILETSGGMARGRVRDTGSGVWQDRPMNDGRPRPGSGKVAAAAADGVTLRQLAGHDDYHACFELQLATWGRDFQEGVPPSVLKISQRVGGIAAGAFAADGRLLGFVYGLTGVRPTARPAPGRPELLHWSHMLAVAPEARDLGLGRRLKLYQRELLLPLGVEVVEWTYDPLEARNAHLNLNRLGAEVVAYVEDMYQGEMGSELARGIGTDRFIVAWRIAGEDVRRALSRPDAGADPRQAAGPPARFAAAPRFEPAPLRDEGGAAPPGVPDDGGSAPPAVPNEGGSAPPAVPDAGGPPLPDAPRVGIEVPAQIQHFKDRQPERALAWRLGTRRAFEAYLARGYSVTAFWRDSSGRCWYGVEAPGR
ncbi:MAG TPA: hypothetical protein VKY89_09895 [Thermoanaerobaculia bacterium]|nr:hypothetical protein [Thermoanaerobaculia bacterium]